ncbi:hypothetical protein F5J12DRAFT_779978 [Pisolithus orientalis]|uniref:uncharacterized protein n=1 Tax=Pisolithus orientalis TaxID=936130 RepID=UPI0022254F6F|nr:uncharacterized protein F5J12DRAFT_779978 [Pisolithus orientalis]KAI6030970.1 hypothetical protein F5J12DRAFT_779978 [Pisolithus orientalis]
MLPGGSAGQDKAKPSLGVIRLAGQGLPETVKAEASVSEGQSHTLGLGQGNKKARSDQARLRGVLQSWVRENWRPKREGWKTSLGAGSELQGYRVSQGVLRRPGWVQGLLQGVTGSESVYLQKEKTDNRKLRKHITRKQETKARGRGQSQRLRPRVAQARGGKSWRLRLGVAEASHVEAIDPEKTARAKTGQGNRRPGRPGTGLRFREDWKGQLETGLMVKEGLEKPGGDQSGASEGWKG